jgi:malate dehydrogenase
LGIKTRISGTTNDYSKTANSDVVVITSGIPRKPGMTREELIGTNANIVKTVAENVLKHSPNAIIIVVSNPMDTMTYLALKATGLPKNRIIGMGGLLDSARFKCYLGLALEQPTADIQGTVIGGHGDTTMIPLTRLATLNGIPVSTKLSADQLKEISDATMVGGATLTKLLGTSAWYAPGAAAAQMVEAIVRDQKRIFPVCAWLDGEYGMKEIYLGVPVKLGKNGIEEIIELKLDAAEMDLLKKSGAAVKEVMDVLSKMQETVK